ncbi:MAG: FAD-dependent monooxygenase, partial [Phenylobacterium sp.]
MDADVIIAGAGMAGATLALGLARSGLKTLLVDTQPFDAQLAPDFDGRASAIAYSSFRQWRALGLAGDLEPHAERIHELLVTDGRTPGPAAGGPAWAFLRFDAAEIADRSEGEPLGADHQGGGEDAAIREPDTGVAGREVDIGDP